MRHWASCSKQLSCCLYTPLFVLIDKLFPKHHYSAQQQKRRHRQQDTFSHSHCQPPFYVITSCERPVLIRAWAGLLLLIHHIAHQLHTAKSIKFLEEPDVFILYPTLISTATGHDIYHIRPVFMSTTLQPYLHPSDSTAPVLSLLPWKCQFQDNCVVETKNSQTVYIANDTNTWV